jgi:hypothetical protein
VNRYGLTSLALALAFAAASAADGFEVATHAAITQNAQARFAREHPGKVDDLGVYSLLSALPLPPIFGHAYYDVYGDLVATRQDWSFENKIMSLNTIQADPMSIVGWLMRGAIREDDGYLPIGQNPQDDLYFPAILRFSNHFYDPRNDRPLTVSPWGVLGAKAPNWATGAQDVFNDPNARDNSRRNHFTIFDAQEAMFRALTFKTRDSGGSWVDLASSGAADKQAIRQAYWATTFRALGDVLHLNQDMAQPQHTRNESHSGAYALNLGHSSFMERYLDARVRIDATFSIDYPPHNVQTFSPNPLHFAVCDAQDQNCNDYPLDVSKFTTYRDFWTTSPHGVGGIGLADYSNPGFFTPMKNLGAAQNDYDLPPNNPSSANYSVEDIGPTSWSNVSIPGPPIHLLDRAVSDYLNPGQTAAAVRLTSFSMWDEFMQQSGAAPTYHLVRENYDAAERLLIPRAVAYSSGLLSFFFRGSMAISAPDEGVYGIVDHSTLSNVDPLIDFKGFDTIRLKVKNTSPPLANTSVPEPMAGGTLFAVLKFHRNTCFHNDMSDGEPGVPNLDPFGCRSTIEEIVVSDKVASVTLTDHDQEISFSLNQGQLPINATDVYLQLVYRGPLGSESDAVVVATKNISEPTFVTYQNATDYIHLGATVYKRADFAGNLTLLGAVRPQSCVDYTAQPAQLKASCFAPGPVTWGLSIGTAPTSIQITGLPPRRLARFAYLTDVVGPVTITQSGTCLPTDPVAVQPVVWQNTYDAAQGDLDEHYTVFQPVRGVYSFQTIACRYFGDSSDPHSPDDLFTKADALQVDVGELTPFPIAITQ